MKTNISKPLHHYNLYETQENISLQGPSRVLELFGRKGINTTSIHSRVCLHDHTLNQTSGSLEIWFFPLEDLSPSYSADHMAMNNAFHSKYPLISDYKNPNDMASASFAIMYEKRWHPQFYAKLYKGDLHYRLEPPIKAFTTSEHMDFKKNQWYQIIFTWDKTLENYRLYVNGVFVGAESQFDHDFHIDPCGELLYLGNPAICTSQVNFYNEVFTKEQVLSFYQESANSNPLSTKELQHIYTGSDRKQFTWQIDKQWQEKLSLSLKEEEHINAFHLQGYTDAPSITSEGLLIETPQVRQHASTLDSQVYVWSKDVFEGDLYVEYEFKSLKPGGLSLLMVNAAGMNREDFLKDYPLRTNGSMITVYGEDVRNYHWEYYREMNDVRNDVASCGLTKNPYLYPLAYGCLDKALDKNKWHKLQYLQRGGRIIGAINGVIMIDTLDTGASHSGDFYDFGHIAIRCMVHTKLLVRDLKVFNRLTDFNIID